MFFSKKSASFLVLCLAACGGELDATLTDEGAAAEAVAVEGQVVGMDGPLAGAYVRAWDNSGNTLGKTRTDAAGLWSLQVASVPYAIEVKAFDHVPRLYRTPAYQTLSNARHRFDVHVGPVLGADTTAENVTWMVLETATGPRVVPHVAWGTGGSLEPWIEAPNDLLVGARNYRLDTLLPDNVRLPHLENAVAVRRDHLEVRFSSQLNRYNLGSEYFAAMVQQISATVSHNFSPQTLPVKIMVACTTCSGGYAPLRDGVLGATGPNGSYRVTVPHFDRAFTDTAGHRYAAHLAMAKHLGIATGYSDGSDRPNNNVTRAEFAAMLVAALQLPLVTPRAPSYRDVPSTYWAYRSIETARARNLISGGADGNFRPTGTLTRAELAGFISNAAGWTGDSARQSFSDVPQTYWAHRRIETAFGWCQAVQARSWSDPARFEPAAAATRAEAIAAVMRMLNCLVGNEPK